MLIIAVLLEVVVGKAGMLRVELGGETVKVVVREVSILVELVREEVFVPVTPIVELLLRVVVAELSPTARERRPKSGMRVILGGVR